MSHQRYSSHDAIKEPHSVSVKVLRLSRPSLVAQYPIDRPLTSASASPEPTPASLACRTKTETKTAPFLLSPILKLPVSFGSAYVGETFSCTLCVNNDLPVDTNKKICEVRMAAEMKTPGQMTAQELELRPGADDQVHDLDSGGTLQRVLSFDLKEEGNHVLAVTVSYYEATETSGRTRTFRKLYQFICKPSLIVRTKIGSLGGRSWVLEAQLENCSDATVQLEKVVMELDDGFAYADCNWEGSKPLLLPGAVEQACFVVVDERSDEERAGGGRLTFGTLGIGWRGQMGNRGFLSTGKLGTRPR
ncbi:Trafficking protein particle complex subunit 13 [Ophiocordyceps camponoti-floridani]|uniref:Trafficking protein particle complex subunit 13 n=1 Tax=Ophiocordyceps camponoti-floridani TaxID=2030778 RepID=A0A8H4Q1R3_9HYPO|nr:Trafficking protein particle complex subunit 13 [Ophiocordyceps camponoti-floridani]